MDVSFTEACYMFTGVGKTWVDYLSALLVPVIALLGVYIALNQWHTNRNRLKHELFERRFAQYVALGEFLGYIKAHGATSDGMWQRFKDKLRGMPFIYDQKIYEHVENNIWKPAKDLDTVNSELRDTSLTKEARARLVAQTRTLKDDLEEELRGLDALLGKYLKLGH